MNHFEWAVIGAGPAGIAAIGKLVDTSLSKENILWLDPEFGAGDLGQFWCEVPSNTKIISFKKYLHGCHAFHFDQSPETLAIKHIANDAHCDLSVIVEALLWITTELRKAVTSENAFVTRLQREDDHWKYLLR